MPIVYSVVSRDETILAEHNAASKGNVPAIVRQLLQKIPSDQNMKKTYTAEGVYFNYIVESGFIFLCVSIQDTQAIKSEWKTTYGAAANNATAYAMNEDFGRVLARKMEFYSNDPSVDKIRAVSEQIDSVKSTMVKNIEKVIERGEKIEELVDKTETLNYQSATFRVKATQLKKHYRCKNWKISIIFAIFLLALGYAIAAFACGGPLLNRCIGAIFPGGNSTEIVNGTTTSSETQIGAISQAVYNAIGLEYREAVWIEQQATTNKRGIETGARLNTEAVANLGRNQKPKSFKSRATVISALLNIVPRKKETLVNR